LQKEFECALQQYQQALKLEPSEEEIATIHYNLGVLSEDMGKFDDAIEEYQKAMGNNGELGINAINNLARLQIWQKQDNKRAIALLSKAVKQTEPPRLKSVLFKNLGWAYFQIGNYQNAEKSLQEAISLDQDRRAASRCLLAKIQQESDRATALASWQKCRDFDSENLPEVKTWQLDARRYLNTGGKDHEK
jgi:tetratricopeptide (TPR) repeat protein